MNSSTVPGCLLKVMVVLQIAAVAAWDAPAVEEDTGSEAERVVSCAALAQRLLLDLATNPAHGLAPNSSDAQSAAEDIGGVMEPIHNTYHSMNCRSCSMSQAARWDCPGPSTDWGLTDAMHALMLACRRCFLGVCHYAGRKRLQRFMLGLRVTATQAHYDLLLAITAAQPVLAATYLSNASLSLEPRPSLKWWAGVSCLGGIIQRASHLPLPFLEQAQR